jgi:hypothetical protein
MRAEDEDAQFDLGMRRQFPDRPIKVAEIRPRSCDYADTPPAGLRFDHLEHRSGALGRMLAKTTMTQDGAKPAVCAGLARVHRSPKDEITVEV